MAPVQPLRALREPITAALDGLQDPLLLRGGCDVDPAGHLVDVPLARVGTLVALVGSTFALVRESLPLVGESLPLVGESLPLVGESLPPVGQSFTFVGQPV